MLASTQRGRYWGASEEKQHQQHNACKYQLCDLAARARAIRHRGLRRAAVDYERPAHRGGYVGCR
jgi:hypothetical protein